MYHIILKSRLATVFTTVEPLASKCTRPRKPIPACKFSHALANTSRPAELPVLFDRDVFVSAIYAA